MYMDITIKQEISRLMYFLMCLNDIEFKLFLLEDYNLEDVEIISIGEMFLICYKEDKQLVNCYYSLACKLMNLILSIQIEKGD